MSESGHSNEAAGSQSAAGQQKENLEQAEQQNAVWPKGQYPQMLPDEITKIWNMKGTMPNLLAVSAGGNG